MYKVVYEFLNPLGVWVQSDFTNNGEGFTLEDADYLAMDLNLRTDDSSIQTRNARIVEM